MNRLVGAYLLLSGPALFGPHRPAAWPFLLVAHLALAVLLLARARAGREEASPMENGPPRGLRGWILALWPILLIPLLYAELPVLNQAVWGGHYFDAVIIDWELALFGFEPARAFSAALPTPWVSEPLHAAYVSYYLIIYVPPLLIGWKAGMFALRETIFALALVFLAHYLVFIYFPVQGPYYLLPGPAGEVTQWPAYRLTHAILDAGASRGAAFPSSHVGVSVVAAVMCWRWLKPIAPVVTVLAAGLAFGTVYGGFHYAIDAILGAAVGLALAFAAPHMRAWLEPGLAAHPAAADPPSGGRPAAAQ